jgi:nucleotidyltransferase substrate binding protein (TIGR01987 family)
MAALDVSVFEKAISQLEEAVALYNETISNNLRLAKHLRAASIQAFEFTYELAFKMLKRALKEMVSGPVIIEQMTFDEIIRMGYAKGLLKSEIAAWREYRKERNTTSHTYNEEKAQEVFNDIAPFLEDAKFLLNKVKNIHAS